MGRQASFHITGADLRVLEAAIRECGPLTILLSRSPVAKPSEVSSLDVTLEGRTWLFLYLARADDIGKVVTREIPAQKHWTIDSLRSPVIEFMRSGFDQVTLKRGRVHYDTGFFDPDDVWVEKSPEFLSWADCVMKKVKKSLAKNGSDYIGEDAMRLSKEGVILQK